MTDSTATKTRRTRAIGAAIICGLTVIVGVVLVAVLSQNVVYFRTVSEAVHDRKAQGSDRFRLAGAVVPGSRQPTRNGVNFEVTDGTKTVKVVSQGDPPELFKDSAPVLCEGRWGNGLTFDSDRILIRHGEKYNPPKVNTKNAPKVQATASEAKTEGEAAGHAVSTVRAAEPGPERPGPQGQEREL
ncbi:MAG: cytochrome c maturation protein CcmE [Acidimicrobiia bacterium]